MAAAANPITVTWIVGIGLAAVIASAFLLNERTREWSDNRIFFTSILISLFVVVLLLLILERF